MPEEKKSRSIQEYEVTLAHVIANPKQDVYIKLGLDDEANDAIGILTITPSEAAIISADVGTKAAPVEPPVKRPLSPPMWAPRPPLWKLAF